MRVLITLVESLSHYPSVLHNADEIARYILMTDDIGNPDWEEEAGPEEIAAMAEGFRNCSATLREISLDGLINNEGMIDPEQIETYMELETDPPPIIVWGKKICEGNHRVQVARAKGQKTIMAYVIQNNEEPF